MKQLVLISGKGGTGKTSLLASLACLAAAAGPVVTADCDVEASNLALLLPGEDVRTEPFWAGRRARIDARDCALCGACIDWCRSGAIRVQQPPVVNPLACEGCGVCALICAMEAISFVDNQAGVWMERRTAFGPLIHAALGVAQDNSGKLVARVREEARTVAERDGLDLILVDGPPGIGCPVHASVTGCDLAVVVTEPTPSGEHDLDRVLQLLGHFRVPAAVLINKHDLSPRIGDRIEALAREGEAEVVGRLPFSPEVPRALARGELPLAVEAVALPLAAASRNILGLLATGAFGRAEGSSDFIYPPPSAAPDSEASPVETAARAATAGVGAPALGGARRGPRAALRPPRRPPLAKRSPG